MNSILTSARPLSLVALGTLLSVAPAALSQQTPRYRVVDLGTFPWPGTIPAAMSSAGHVAGAYNAPTGYRRSFLWSQGAASDIGSLGTTTTQALAVNAAGVVVGYSVDSANHQRAFRFQSGQLTDLGTLPGGVQANANAINDTGWIVGMSQRRFGTQTYQRPALWRNGEILDLGTFGGEFGEAFGVNNAGQVVGWAWYPPPARTMRAFIWTDATGMTDLGALVGTTSVALDINAQGDVVGYSQSGPPTFSNHAFLWTSQSGMVDLGFPEPSIETTAFGINSRRQIIGNAFDPQTCIEIGVMWNDGVLYQFNDLIEPGSGWSIGEPIAINDAGQIVAAGSRAGSGYHPVLLVPIRTCTPDFNCDGDIGTDADIESFFACLAGSCPDALTCGTGADFNGDGDVGTDADIESFFRVLAGGSC